jgi:hypothetical protein
MIRIVRWRLVVRLAAEAAPEPRARGERRIVVETKISGLAVELVRQDGELASEKLGR